MPGIKVWTGSAFADPSQYRIWNGSAFVTPASMWEWDGSEFVKVWPSFARQRMNKSGNFTISASGWNLLAGWSSDSTYPATTVGEKLVVQGSGTATITWSVTQSGSGTQSARAYYNGTAIGAEFGTGTGGGTRTTTREVSAGDEIYVMVTGVFTSVAAAGTYIDVVPV